MPVKYVEGAAAKQSEPELKTSPFDARFPHMNQTR